MADVSQLEVNGTTYNICDATARDSLSQYCPFPVGAVYLTFDSSNPSTIWTGTTWTQIAAGTFLVASGTDYNLRTTGGAASVTLTSAQSGVPAHAHSLNSHTHSVGAHAHGLNSHKHSVGAHAHGLNSHTHTYDKAKTPTGSTTLSAAQSGVPAHAHIVKFYAAGTSTSGGYSGSSYYISWTGSSEPGGIWKPQGNTSGQYVGGTGNMVAINNTATAASSGHTHTNSYTSTASGAASGNTANSTAFDSGAASGNTANSTAFDSGAASGNTANNTAANASSAHENRPPYMAVAMWERTA